MPNETKTGSYNKFNKYEASWMCPHCHKDSLRLDEKFTYHGKLRRINTFFCPLCGFDSKDYGITIKNNDSFNAAHRKMLRDWKWMNVLLKKGYDIGVIEAEKAIVEFYKIKEVRKAIDVLKNAGYTIVQKYNRF